MAISLSNHEDRIKKLENRTENINTLKQTVLLEKLESGTGTLKDSVRNYPWILLYCVNSWEQNRYVIPFWQSGQHLEINMLYNCPGSSGVKENDWLLYKFTNERAIQIVDQKNMSGFYKIVGLKLYYNFSYNIYSLANSISFHFFKCLINSFKGGVKEIWQLV